MSCLCTIVPVTLTKVDADHDLLKAFHSLLYGVIGKKTVRKKNIRRYVLIKLRVN